MKILRPVLLAVTLTMIVSSTAFAGNIGGLRASGNIAGPRSAGNIGGAHNTSLVNPNIGPRTPAASRFEATLCGTFAGLIRMLLENGALF
jgi:hypothetical protein